MKKKTKYTAIRLFWIIVTGASVLLAHWCFPYTLITAGVGGFYWGIYTIKLRNL